MDPGSSSGVTSALRVSSSCHPGLRAGIHAFKCASRRPKHGPRIKCGVTTQVRFARAKAWTPHRVRGDNASALCVSESGPRPSSCHPWPYSCHPGPIHVTPALFMSPRPPSRGPSTYVEAKASPMVLQAGGLSPDKASPHLKKGWAWYGFRAKWFFTHKLERL